VADRAAAAGRERDAVAGGRSPGRCVRLLGLGVILDSAPVEITRRTFTPIGIDWRILAFALALSTASGLLFGTLPAWRAARVNASEALNQASRSATSSRAQRRVRTGLAAAEIALAVVLLSGAGLLINSFVRLQRVDVGFDMRDLLTVALQVPADRYATGAVRLAFLEEIASRVRDLPGVSAVTVAGGAPPGSGILLLDISPEAEGRSPVGLPPRASLPVTPIAPDYFATLGIPLLEGRTFTAADHDQR
jgi:putative ABC transport system permease protein